MYALEECNNAPDKFSPQTETINRTNKVLLKNVLLMITFSVLDSLVQFCNRHESTYFGESERMFQIPTSNFILT